MNKTEMQLILKKIRGECGLGEPEKLTYYRNKDGKVVFKAWFDELITPQELIDTDREASDTKRNKIYSQFHDEDQIEYEDDFAIVDFNLHKGWVKFIPNDQDYKYVESFRDIKQDKLGLLEVDKQSITLVKGNLIKESAASSYGFIYEDDSSDALDDANESEEDGTAAQDQADKALEVPPTKIFVYSGRALALVQDAVKNAFQEVNGMIKEIQAGDDASEGQPYTIKFLYVPYSDYLLLGTMGYSKTVEAAAAANCPGEANLYLDNFADKTKSTEILDKIQNAKGVAKKMFLVDSNLPNACSKLAGYVSSFDQTMSEADNKALKIFMDLKSAEETALNTLEASCKSFLEKFKEHLDKEDFEKGEELAMKIEDKDKKEGDNKENSSENSSEQSTESSGEQSTSENANEGEGNE